MKFDTQGWYLERGHWGDLDGILIAPRTGIPSALVTLCHGFGAPGTDLVSLTEELVPALSDDFAPPAFLFPEGPIDLEEMYGYPGARAWWPLNMAMLAELAAADAFSALEDQVPDGIDSAREKLVESISACVASKSWERIAPVVGGFSQGSMLAVDISFRGGGFTPCGVIVWSGAMICKSVWAAAPREGSIALSVDQSFRVYQSHGRQDPILPISSGRALYRFLREMGCDIEMDEFDGPHTISLEGIGGAARLIERAISAQ